MNRPRHGAAAIRVVLSTAARGAPTASHNSACSGMPGRGPPEEGIRVVAPFARRGEHAEVHQQARVNLPGGPQRRRSARAGIDRWVRQPRSRVHSGDRLRAATGREGGGQCVFQRRHRATHARGGDGAGPLPSIARFRRRMHWLPAGGEPVGLRRIELPTAGWYGCCHRRRTPAVVG